MEDRCVGDPTHLRLLVAVEALPDLVLIHITEGDHLGWQTGRCWTRGAGVHGGWARKGGGPTLCLLAAVRLRYSLRPCLPAFQMVKVGQWGRARSSRKCTRWVQMVVLEHRRRRLGLDPATGCPHLTQALWKPRAW